MAGSIAITGPTTGTLTTIDPQGTHATITGTDLETGVVTAAAVQAAIVRGADLETGVVRAAAVPVDEERGTDLETGVVRAAAVQAAVARGADLETGVVRTAAVQAAEFRSSDLETGAERAAAVPVDEERGADLEGAVVRAAVVPTARIAGGDLEDAGVTPSLGMGGNYNFGDPVKVTLAVILGGRLVEPTTATLSLRQPNGVVLTPTVVHNSLGRYSALFTPALPGTYVYTWTTGGTVVTTQTDTFTVLAVPVPTVFAESFAFGWVTFGVPGSASSASRYAGASVYGSLSYRRTVQYTTSPALAVLGPPASTQTV